MVNLFPTLSCSVIRELTAHVHEMTIQNLAHRIGQGTVPCEENTVRQELTTNQHG